MVSRNYKATYLFAMPTFLRGMARVLDLGDTLTVYNTFKDENTADYEALKRDWEQVGIDIAEAMKEYEHAEK